MLPDSVEVLAGRLDTIQIWEPFNYYNFIYDLSTEIIQEYDDGELLTFAYWLRKKLDAKSSSNRLGRGLVFHICPSNVLTNFLYSWAFGLMSGNSNVVRIPEGCYSPVLFSIQKVLSKYPEFYKSNVFINCSYEDVRRISRLCDIRVIWGGDETIRKIKSYPTQPHCFDIPFTDRYSICIIDCIAMSELNDEAFDRFITRFYNDAYLFDQNACSSPKLIAWYNYGGYAIEIEEFWDGLQEEVMERYHQSYSQSFNKFTDICDVILQNKEVKAIGNFRCKRIKMPLAGMIDFSFNSGTFYEVKINTLDELEWIVNRKLQTITYYGIERDFIKNWILKDRLKGVDRIVPVGSAMNMTTTWDGFDMIRTLSREIVC